MLNRNIEEAVKKQAELTGINEAGLLAVVDVESGGEPFYTINGEQYPVIRFEGHYFYKRLNKEDRRKAVQAGLASPKVGGVPNPSSGSQRYALLQRAIAINEEAALESCSWGLGQVMGSNWKELGRASVQDLVRDAYDLQGQIDLMTDFIQYNNLDDEIDRQDWAGFAKGYNGPSYKKNAYDTKLKKAYKKYAGKDTNNVALNETIKLQQQLNQVSGMKVTVDGDLGPQTVRAIKDFQLKAGLTVDGIAGPLTREKLAEATSQKVSNVEKVIGAGAFGIGGIATAVQDATGFLQPLIEYSDLIKYAFVALVLVGVFFTFKSYLFKSA